MTHWSARPDRRRGARPGGRRRRSGSATSATTGAERPVGLGHPGAGRPRRPRRRRAVVRLTYPDGPRDAETLLARPGDRPAVRRQQGRLRRHGVRRPAQLRADRHQPAAPRSATCWPIATDGAFFPDGRHLIVRNYSEAAVYSWPSLERGGPLRPARPAAGRGHRGRRRTARSTSRPRACTRRCCAIALPPTSAGRWQPPVASPTPAPSVTRRTPAPGRREGASCAEAPPATGRPVAVGARRAARARRRPGRWCCALRPQAAGVAPAGEADAPPAA